VTPDYAVHTHPLSGHRFPISATQDFIPTTTEQPSQDDLNLAKGTGTPGLILVPTKRVLVRVNTNGTYDTILSDKEYDAWIKKAEAAQQPPSHP